MKGLNLGWQSRKRRGFNAIRRIKDDGIVGKATHILMTRFHQAVWLL